jgi:hypothetical protein
MWMLLQGNLGLAELLTGDTDAARHAFREELRPCRELVDRHYTSEGLRGLAELDPHTRGAVAVDLDAHEPALLNGVRAVMSVRRPFCKRREILEVFRSIARRRALAERRDDGGRAREGRSKCPRREREGDHEAPLCGASTCSSRSHLEQEARPVRERSPSRTRAE